MHQEQAIDKSFVCLQLQHQLLPDNANQVMLPALVVTVDSRL